MEEEEDRRRRGERMEEGEEEEDVGGGDCLPACVCVCLHAQVRACVRAYGEKHRRLVVI